MSSYYGCSFFRTQNLKPESVGTAIPYMATYKIPLLSYSISEGEDPVRTHTIIPNKMKCER